jgi:hypothetical protein
MRVEYQPPYWWGAQDKRKRIEKRVRDKEFSRKLEDTSRRLDYTLVGRTYIRDHSDSTSPTIPTATMNIWTIRIGEYSTTTTSGTLTGEGTTPIFVTVQTYDKTCLCF